MTFVGEREVKNIDGTTVTYVDETTQVLTERQLEYMVSDEPRDASTMQMLLIPNVLPDMCEALVGKNLSDTTECILALITVLEKHNIRKGDTAFVINNFTAISNSISQWLAHSFDDAYYRAVGKAFGTYQEWMPFEYCDDNIRVSDIKRVQSL